ncbi:MAG: hypothetical protein M3Q66_02430 [Chloroflexota bacterium]|nr:hypothetical protein [Chloroflexota bacterium]
MTARRRPRDRSEAEMAPEAREAMFRVQRITREMYALPRDTTPAGIARYRALADEKRDLLAITHADWQRRCRP